jgi:hypothetical protein
MSHCLKSVAHANELDHTGQIGRLKGWAMLAAIRVC